MLDVWSSLKCYYHENSNEILQKCFKEKKTSSVLLDFYFRVTFLIKLVCSSSLFSFAITLLVQTLLVPILSYKMLFGRLEKKMGRKHNFHQKCKSPSFLIEETERHKVPQGGFFRRDVAFRQSILKKSSVQFYRHCQEGIAVFRMWGNNYV